jgi:hypothetical protein
LKANLLIGFIKPQIPNQCCFGIKSGSGKPVAAKPDREGFDRLPPGLEARLGFAKEALPLDWAAPLSRMRLAACRAALEVKPLREREKERERERKRERERGMRLAACRAALEVKPLRGHSLSAGPKSIRKGVSRCHGSRSKPYGKPMGLRRLRRGLDRDIKTIPGWDAEELSR